MAEEEFKVLLARIDERTKNIENRLSREYEDIKEDIAALRKEIKENYVDKNSFNPIQRAVFTSIGVVLLGVIAAVMNIVIPKG